MKRIPEAIRDLFGIESAADSKFLADKANSFKRNGLLDVKLEHGVQRSATYIDKDQETVLFNALLLSAVFTDPKHVKKIFDEPIVRAEAAQTLSAMLLQRTTVCGMALSSAEATLLVTALEGDFDLYGQKLPNPFETLPQMLLGPHTNLLNALLAQAAALDPVDSVLAAWVAGDIENAYRLANEINNSEPVAPFLEMVKKRYHELQRLSRLLKSFSC
ncbi:hypothetical protein [Parathalassolituus penaei]|uniref:Uncharacterized protein n=1 Tax=Parathalassolituus penaei TaxID=2997323 RepID=A0A9X3ECN0_9GAMM|nr:hypothetical protein [Parathalassolituus penaei]MCY0965163.1 hypothetical protein [Parathalassolituus penaei]